MEWSSSIPFSVKRKFVIIYANWYYLICYGLSKNYIMILKRNSFDSLRSERFYEEKFEILRYVGAEFYLVKAISNEKPNKTNHLN